MKTELRRAEAPYGPQANSVLEVSSVGQKAHIRAELDDLHELRLFIGSDALGWSARRTGSTSVMATVEASGQVKLADGSSESGLVFQAWSVRHNIAMSPDGPVPYGEVVFRPTSRITNENGTFTFADIRQANGTLVPISVCVRLSSSNSHESPSFGPEVNGLRAAVELISPNGVFALGEPIDVLFHIRNTSSMDIYVAGGSWRQDDAPYITIEDQQGQQIPVQPIFYTVHTPTRRSLLLPGEIAVFHSSGLAFLAKDADGKQVTQPVGHYVKVTPGRYTVRYRLHFPDLKQTGLPQPYDWQGDLDTAPVTVEVTAASSAG